MHVCCTRATLCSLLTKSASRLPQEEAGSGLGLDLELCLGWNRVWAKESDGDSSTTMLGVTIRQPVCWIQRAAATSLPQAENHKLTKFISYKVTKIKPSAIPPRLLCWTAICSWKQIRSSPNSALRPFLLPVGIQDEVPAPQPSDIPATVFPTSLFPSWALLCLQFACLLQAIVQVDPTPWKAFLFLLLILKDPPQTSSLLRRVP